MNNRLPDEYLKILQELVDQQYSEEESDTLESPENAWIYSEPEIKLRLKKFIPNYHGVVDVTNFKQKEIEKAICEYMLIRVDNFLLKINSYQGDPHTKNGNANLTMNIGLWEKRFQTPSGNSCNMEFKLAIHKDTRFTGRPWLKLFTQDGSAVKVPHQTVVEIIRWLQAVRKLTAFL